MLGVIVVENLAGLVVSLVVNLVVSLGASFVVSFDLLAVSVSVDYLASPYVSVRAFYHQYQVPIVLLSDLLHSVSSVEQ